ncbi:MAG: putative molybdenum carrier protein [Phycisphaerae bacterium]|nr:putative molybdenum carrier protein [Phycisphaerae bacterium]
MAVIYVEKIVSGGQTGVDRAAMDWAIRSGVPHGGWCPRGRLAEDGPIPQAYDLRETPSDEYAERTAWNVRDSDATVIMSLHASITGGTELTQRLAQTMGKPVCHVHADLGMIAAVAHLREFLIKHSVKVLNVAGPRASREPTVGEFVSRVLDGACPYCPKG